MNKLKFLASIIAIGFGIFMVIFGERDDSPGAQLLGVLLAVAGVVGLAKSRKRLR